MDGRRRLLAAAFSVALRGCDASVEAAVSSSGETSTPAITSLDDDALDHAAFVAVRDDALEDAVAAFAEVLRRDSADAFAAMWLGMLAVRRDLYLAERAFSHAVEHVEQRMWVEDEAEAFALAAKRAGLEMSLRRVRERIAAAEAKQAHNSTVEETSLVRPQPIRRVDWREIGQAEFESSHAEAGVPVIITGIGSLTRDGAPPWTLDYLRATCGHLPPRVAAFNPRSATWAGMHKAPDAAGTFSEYVDALLAGDGSGVVFDWGLRLEGGCKELLSTFAVPSFFTRTIVAGYGPGLFVQPNGTRCGLHFDTGGTHFWQYVWSGAKRWRIFRVEDWPRLFAGGAWRRAFFRDARCAGLFGAEAEEAAGCADGFGAVANDGFDDEHLATLADGAPLEFYEEVLRPGELMFVPANMPHQVVNVGGSPGVAVSMNYVDFTNLPARERWHLENADTHPRFRSRLNKSGEMVPGSKTRWFERFRMPVENAEFRRVIAAVQHVAQQPERTDAAFLEPWESLKERPWNLQRVDEAARM